MGRHSSEADLTTDWRTDRLGTAQRGQNPMVLAHLRSGWAVIGDTQFLPGYCVLISHTPEVDHLTDLPRRERADFLTDMGLLGEAVLSACNGLDPSFRRLNYEILGNVDRRRELATGGDAQRRLHAHVFPRYGWEPEELLEGPVWHYPPDRWTSPRDAYAEEHEPLRQAIATQLRRVMAEAYGSI
jgi:diadenosine tetraphosphate (Ap4A) HIT family hydrolase